MTKDDEKFVSNLEKRSMSSWSEEELYKYQALTGQPIDHPVNCTRQGCFIANEITIEHVGECAQSSRDAELLRVCDDPDTVFYGPYPCEVCGKKICKASREQGGMEFLYPEEIIYPNTNWVQHVCFKSGMRIGIH